MEQEYIVVNKTKLLDAIKEFKEEIHTKDFSIGYNEGSIDMIDNIIAISTPLEPIVSGACNAGGNICCSNTFYNDSEDRYEVNVIAIKEEIEEYINNLKLEI